MIYMRQSLQSWDAHLLQKQISVILDKDRKLTFFILKQD